MSIPNSFPLTLHTFLLPGPAGELEVMTEAPDAINQDIVAIICHPHPLFGGTMKNKVVSTLARTCKELAIPTVRFNFRGVGQSTGTFDEGVGEVDDLLAVLAWVKTVKPQAKVWLAGFSFGACISAKVAARTPAIAQLISIAPPVMRWEFEKIHTMTCPWLVVQGDADEVVPATEVFAWFAQYHPAATVIDMPGASHFFHGRLIELREQLLAVLTEAAL